MDDQVARVSESTLKATGECRGAALASLVGICLSVVLLLGNPDPILFALGVGGLLACSAYGLAHLTAFACVGQSEVRVRWFPPTRRVPLTQIDGVGVRTDGVLLRTPVLKLRDGSQVGVMALTSYPSRVSERVALLEATIASARAVGGSEA